MTDYAGLEEAVREIFGRVVVQIEEEHAKHLTEELRIQSRELNEYAARIDAYTVRIAEFTANYNDALKMLAAQALTIKKMNDALGHVAKWKAPEEFHDGHILAVPLTAGELRIIREAYLGEDNAA